MSDISAPAAPLDDLFAPGPTAAVRSFAWSPKAKALSGLHGWLHGLLTAYLAAEVGFAAFAGFTLWVLSSVENGAEWSDAQYALVDMLLSYGSLVTALVGLVLLVAAAILFCRFVYRALKNLHLSNARGELMPPGWAVAYNFIPIMNIWKPHQAMRQIWRTSRDPERGRFDPPGTMWGWWMFWLFSNWISNLSFRLYMSAGGFADELTDYELYKSTFWLDIASSFCMVVSIAFLLPILKQIAEAQEALEKSSAV